MKLFENAHLLSRFQYRGYNINGLISNPIRHLIYIDGTEHISMVEGYSLRGGSYTEYDEYIRLIASESYNTAVRTTVTDVAIDLRAVNKVFLEYICLYRNSYSYMGECYLVASTNKTGNYTTYDARKQVQNIQESISESYITFLDVSGLSGDYYIRCHAYDPSGSGGWGPSFNIKKIWTE